MATKTLLESYSSFRREVALMLAGEIKSAGFGYKQMLIFIFLSEKAATMSDISVFTQSDKGATTRAIASLEAEGWVKRSEHRNDRRSTYVELTASGKKKAAQALKIKASLGDSLDRTLSKDERRLLMGLLDKVTSGLIELRK